MQFEEAYAVAERTRSYNAFISLASDASSGGDFVVSVKDNVDVAGFVTTAGGRHLPDVPAASDAPAVARIRQAGGAIIGKANMHEYAYGLSSRNPHYGNVVNPLDPIRIPGGSSGGSAVSVVIGTCDWSLGSDTGGSVRIPASFCGLVSAMATAGRVPGGGVIPLAATFDALCPLAHDVETVTSALGILTGEPAGIQHRFSARNQPKLAVPGGWVHDLDDQTSATWGQVAAALPTVDFPGLAAIHESFEAVFQSEVAAFHEDWMRERPDLYGDDVRQLITLAMQVPRVHDYANVARERERVAAEIDQAINGFDALLLPATAIVAPVAPATGIREPLLRFTIPFSYTGHPVYSLPGPSSGLPVGIQVIGRRGDDRNLSEVAAYLEATWHAAVPS